MLVQRVRVSILREEQLLGNPHHEGGRGRSWKIAGQLTMKSERYQAVWGTEMQSFEEHESDNPSLKALDLILAAWDEGADTGVAPEQMAYAALFTALTDLVSIYGEQAVIKLTRGLEARVDSGEFTLQRRHQ